MRSSQLRPSGLRAFNAAWEILGFTILLALAPGVSRAQAAPKPNFILILADDMGYGDIGPFGSVKNRTPNLDRMAREGMKLTSFYAAPVCTPSRAQILTGCYAKRVSLPQVLSPAAPIGLSASEHSHRRAAQAAGLRHHRHRQMARRRPA